MKVYHFSDKDNIYKIFQVLDKLPKKQKEVFLEIDAKNDFFSNKWWLKLVLEKAQDVGVKPVFVITSPKQEALLKTFGVNYIWKKEPIATKIRNAIFDFIEIFKGNYFSHKHSKLFKILIVVGEIFVLFWAVYFVYNLVTPKTDVYIQPAVKIKHLIQKIYIASNPDNVDERLPVIKYYTWEFVKVISVKLPVKDITYLSKPAKWLVKFVNYSTVWYSLKAHTQLVTDDGLIFRLDNWVYVPGAKSPSEPGVAYVKVTADKNDIHWQLIWARWNISKWTKLYIRKMYISIWKKKIYAVAADDFSHWELNPTWEVTLADIENMKRYLKSTLDKNLSNYIKTYIQQNIKDGYGLVFSGMYTVKDIQYFIQAKPGDKLAYLPGNLQAKIQFSYVKKTALKELFKKYLENHIVSMSDFIGWNDSSLQILKFEKVFPNLYLATINFDAILGYDFKKDYNHIKEQILEQIPGLPIDKAKAIILSYPVIAGVEIKTTNSLNRVSQLKSRIYIYIVK